MNSGNRLDVLSEYPVIYGHENENDLLSQLYHPDTTTLKQL